MDLKDAIAEKPGFSPSYPRPTARVIAYTRFLGVPPELSDHGIREDQDQGTDLARLIECSGRACYDSYSRGRDSAAYHEHILEVGHGSVIEHASISFYLTMSRGCSHEWIRHRVGVGISQRSTRFVSEDTSPWLWHPLVNEAVREDEALEGELEELIAHARRVYGKLTKRIEERLTAQGVDKLSARKQGRGAARGALGNALQTEMVWSANIRALRHVLEMRASEFADAEIRLLANAVYEAALPVCPEYLSDYEKYESPDGVGYCLRSAHQKV